MKKDNKQRLFEVMQKIDPTFLTENVDDNQLVIVKRKMGFTWKEVGRFNSMDEAEKYCDDIIKRISKSNMKANKDNRINAYGAQELPWFEINDEIYDSPYDGRLNR